MYAHIYNTKTQTQNRSKHSEQNRATYKAKSHRLNV